MDGRPPRQALELAALVQQQARGAALVPEGSASAAAAVQPALAGPLQLYDALVTQATLRQATRQLFFNGHYALAVEEAYKCLNNVVRNRVGATADGSGLMKSAFSLQNPLLRLNELRTQSQKDQQLGYMEIFSGCMTGIRNPRAHEHQYADEPQVALELLTWANHLMRLALTAKKPKRPRQAPKPAAT